MTHVRRILGSFERIISVARIRQFAATFLLWSLDATTPSFRIAGRGRGRFLPGLGASILCHNFASSIIEAETESQPSKAHHRRYQSGRGFCIALIVWRAAICGPDNSRVAPLQTRERHGCAVHFSNSATLAVAVAVAALSSRLVLSGERPVRVRDH